MQDELENTNDQSGFSAGFLLGLVIGGAGGYFLTTEQGRKLLKQVTAQAGDKLEVLKDNEFVQVILENLKELPSKSEVKETVKEKVNAVATSVVEATSPAKPPVKRHLFSSGGAPLKK